MKIVPNIEPKSTLRLDNHNEYHEKMLKDQDEFDYFDKYYDLHKEFLQPTSMLIDIDLFHQEINQYHSLFRQWGNNRPHIQRYGISLFNLDGDIRGEEDIGCQPLDLAPKKYQDEKLFTTPTEVYKDMISMRPLDPLKDYYCRSSILLWHKGGSFLPHVDLKPSKQFDLRLWGNSDPDGYIFNGVGEIVDQVEPGRMYLCDTSKWHYAKATKDWNYTFFISFNRTAIDFVKTLLV